jgi:hypothetical protein
MHVLILVLERKGNRDTDNSAKKGLDELVEIIE